MASDYKARSIAYRDYRHSHDDTEYNVPSKKVKKKHKKGCPSNDGKAHVYEWFKVFYEEGTFKETIEQTCIGCGKVYTRKLFGVSDSEKELSIEYVY